MAWFKVDDQLAFHAKTILAGNSAMGLWVRAGAWASAHLTDGFIPTHMANAMANPMANPCDSEQLVEAGLWIEKEGGYQFHDWELFQPDSKAEKARREEVSRARSEAGKAGAEARWRGQEPDITDGKAMANAWQADGKAMAPSRPVPSSSREAPRPKRHRLTDDFTPSEAHHKKAKELGVDIDAELEKFKNHFIGNGDTKLDWGRTFSNWLTRSTEFNNGRPQGPPRPQSGFDPWAGDWSEDEIRRQKTQ